MIIKPFGVCNYLTVWEQMKIFTSQRKSNTCDELWLLEHEKVYTLGQAGKKEHILNPGTIPIIHSDRGGQITFHAPGQLVGYLLMDLKKRKIGVKALVHKIEQILIEFLLLHQIKAITICGMPGVFVAAKKIASIGLRVRNNCTYHGFALNVSMDLSPFEGINPCGFDHLEMTQMSNFVPNITVDSIKQKMGNLFLSHFGE